ncbi:MAG: methyltransferase domain-containing protein [Rhodospirillaceae bacterium]|nr:methyltransferase domain-containing protein [Rhodospirillaceae bacterium]
MQRVETAARAVAPPGPAEIYDSRFVPALFGPWGPVVAGEAAVGPGHAVLDVACGTGALAVAAAGRVGPGGRVVGLDANPQMLAVARAKPVAVTWQEGRAEALPFEDASFDAVVSQFGLMFFDDPALALREMMRVLKPGGRLAVAVCDGLVRSPGYHAFWRLLGRLFGEAVANAFAAPFALGDAAALRAIAVRAGLADAEIRQRQGTVRFASIADLVSTERACVWTLGGLLDDAQFALLAAEADGVLAPFRTAEGQVEFVMPALIVCTAKPA